MPPPKFPSLDAKLEEQALNAYRKVDCPWCQKRLLAVYLYAGGEFTAQEVADRCGFSRGHLFLLLRKVREHGIEAFTIRAKTGPKPGSSGKVPEHVVNELVSNLREGGTMSIADGAKWLKKTHQIDRSCQTIRRWLSAYRSRSSVAKEAPLRPRGWNFETLRWPHTFSETLNRPTFVSDISPQNRNALVQKITWNQDGSNRLVAWILINRGSLHEKHRNRWIGWSPETRDSRISQVANLKAIEMVPTTSLYDQKFDVSEEEMLDAFLKQLPEVWKTKFGVDLQLVECRSSSKIKSVEREDNGWILLSGYPDEERFIFPTSPQARKILRESPISRLDPIVMASKGHRRGQKEFKNRDFKGLHKRMAVIPDLRRKHARKLPLRSLLTLYCLSYLCDMRGPRKVQKWCETLSDSNLKAIGIKRDGKRSILSYRTMSRLGRYLELNPDAMSMVQLALKEWLLMPGRPCVMQQHWLNRSRKWRYALEKAD